MLRAGHGIQKKALVWLLVAGAAGAIQASDPSPSPSLPLPAKSSAASSTVDLARQVADFMEIKWRGIRPIITPSTVVNMRMAQTNMGTQFYIQFRHLGFTGTHGLYHAGWYVGQPKAAQDGNGYTIVVSPPLPFVGSAAASFGGRSPKFLVRLPLDGRAEVLQTLPPTAGSYDISPNRRQLIYQDQKSPAGSTAMISVDLDTGTTRSIGKGLFPAFSPDGRTLAYVSMRRIRLRDLATGNERILAHDEILKELPSWSPDGRTIVYQARPAEDLFGYEIYKVDVATDRVTRLTRHYGKDVNPVFTGDGQEILFMSECSEQGGGPGLHLMRADGTDLRRDGAQPPSRAENYIPAISPSAIITRDSRLVAAQCQVTESSTATLELPATASPALSSPEGKGPTTSPSGGSRTSQGPASAVGAAPGALVQLPATVSPPEVTVTYTLDALLDSLRIRSADINTALAGRDTVFGFVRETTGVALVAIPRPAAATSTPDSRNLLLAELPHSSLARPHVSADRKSLTFRFVEQSSRSSHLIRLSQNQPPTVLLTLPLLPELAFDSFDLSDDARTLIVETRVDETLTLFRIKLIPAPPGAPSTSTQVPVPEPLLDANQTGQHPALSSDGKRVAYLSQGAIRVRDLETNADLELVADTHAKSHPTWSPDSRTIAYQFSPDDHPFGKVAIVAVPPAAPGTTPATASKPIRVFSDPNGDLAHPVFAADGTLLSTCDAGDPGHPALGTLSVDNASWQPLPAPAGLIQGMLFPR
jgi:Tol biopolymer transport system component